MALLGPVTRDEATSLYEVACEKIKSLAVFAAVSSPTNGSMEANFAARTRWLMGREVLAICGPNHPQRMVAKILGGGDEHAVASFGKADVARALEKVIGIEMTTLDKAYCSYENAQPAFTIVPSVVLVKAVM